YLLLNMSAFPGRTPSPKCHPRRKWPGSFSPPRELGRELLSAVTGVLLRGNARTHEHVIDGMMDEKIVWIGQPDRNDDATRRVGREKQRDPKPPNESCRRVFPSPIQDACGLRGSSGRIQKAAVSDAVRSPQ